MNADDFQDLQKFGKTLEKTDKRKIKEDIIISLLVKNFLKSILNLFYKLVFIMYNKFKVYLNRFKEWKITRKNNIKFKKQLKLNNKKNNIGYKIVETKIQYANKTIIVRKRIPFYYISGDNEKNISENHIPESHDFIKDSIWDFPVREKKFSESILFWKK